MWKAQPPQFQEAELSERPRSLLLSLGGAIQTLAWVLSWARPGPIPGPRWSRPDSSCALFYSVSDPSRSRGGGPSRPVLVPYCSRAFLTGSGMDGQKQTSWPLPKLQSQRGIISALPTHENSKRTRKRAAYCFESAVSEERTHRGVGQTW